MLARRDEPLMHTSMQERWAMGEVSCPNPV
jgi:hypothetical protein